jgi:hypothetical protein
MLEGQEKGAINIHPIMRLINHGIGDGDHLYSVAREHVSPSTRIRGHLA